MAIIAQKQQYVLIIYDKNGAIMGRLLLGPSGQWGFGVAYACPCIRLCMWTSPFPRDTRHKFELESDLHQNMHKNIERHTAQTIVSWPNHKHRRIFSPSIGKGGHWPWPSRSFWPFWPRMFVIRLEYGFEPNMHFGILSDGIENGGHWPGPSRSFGHLEFQETTFNIALVYWFCSCMTISNSNSISN